MRVDSLKKLILLLLAVMVIGMALEWATQKYVGEDFADFCSLAASGCIGSLISLYGSKGRLPHTLKGWLLSLLVLVLIITPIWLLFKYAF
ncbi:MAG: hypothetical protein UHL07_01370 [Bacteroidaceae bacterium]|nr:hypothetical protein [Bacteroidaceae bacterium]